jgi:glycopeptide antibiotics resistance protein
MYMGTQLSATSRSLRLAEPIGRHLVPPDGIEVPITEPAAPPETGSRLAGALLAYMAAITIVVTLLPFEFALPSRARVMVSGGLFDVVANVALFLPLGFLYALARSESVLHRGRVFLVALLVSAAIESLQLFEATRFASLSDILANGIGAYAGAMGQRWLSRRIAMDARTVGRLSLELPVMGLVYLLVPLLWLDGLAAATSGASLWPMLGLGLFGGSLLAAAQRHHFGPNRLLSRGMMAGLACAWFLVGGFPGLAPRASILLFVMLSAIGVFVWIRSADRSSARSINRRFESKALAEAAPFYAAYLLLLVAPVTVYAGTAWAGDLGFEATVGAWDTPRVLHVVETVAAFTLLGYMLAEFRGRREARFRDGARYIAVWAAGAGAVAELLEGFRPDGGASVLRLVLLIVAALYGSWLYHLQRAHVRRLLGRA